jgi:diguanylate cyclase (GGDEF)-like protein
MKPQSSSPAVSWDSQDLSEFEAETERLLSGRTRDIKLTGEMLRLYLQATWPQRAKIARAWAIWVTLINFAFIPLSYLLIPNEFWLSITIGSVVIPAAHIALYIVWSKPRPDWVEGLSIVVVSALFMLSFGGLGFFSGGVNSERFTTGALYFSTVAIMVFGVGVVWSAAVAICGITEFFGFQLADPAIGFPAAAGTTLYYAMGMFAVVIARRTAVIVRQKSFLMSLRDAYRSGLLEKLATRDPLTGLCNRRFAARRMADIWRDPAIPKSRIAFVMADIDHFKKLNDTAGHAAGDDCIMRVARSIESSVRAEDLVCRHGGEEFLIVLTNVTPDMAWGLAERIRANVEALAILNPGIDPNDPGGNRVTMSVGVAFAREFADCDTVTKWADDALYDAKRSGRNRIFMLARSTSASAGTLDTSAPQIPIPAVS